MSKIILENCNGSTTESLGCSNLDITSHDESKETVIINTNKQITYMMPTITALWLNCPLPLSDYGLNTLVVNDKFKKNYLLVVLIHLLSYII